MNLRKIEKFIDKQKVSFICSTDNEGYPNVKAMLRPRKRTGLKEFYFSTNTSSMRVTQYQNNPNASIYFYHKGLMKYVGIMLRGKMEVLTDQETKNMIWKKGDTMFYKKGVTDPDYCVLKFTATSGRYYCHLKTGNIQFKWTDGTDERFHRFYLITEDYYSKIVGGVENRKSFIPYNISASIQDVLIAYIDDVPVACSGLKKYSEKDVEIKRVWVEPEYRGRHIATDMMKKIEVKAKQQGFQRAILQTREIMTDAVKLYIKLGYYQIDNYPPYNELDGAICFAKDL